MSQQWLHHYNCISKCHDRRKRNHLLAVKDLMSFSTNSFCCQAEFSSVSILPSSSSRIPSFQFCLALNSALLKLSLRRSSFSLTAYSPQISIVLLWIPRSRISAGDRLKEEGRFSSCLRAACLRISFQNYCPTATKQHHPLCPLIKPNPSSTFMRLNSEGLTQFRTSWVLLQNWQTMREEVVSSQRQPKTARKTQELTLSSDSRGMEESSCMSCCSWKLVVRPYRCQPLAGLMPAACSTSLGFSCTHTALLFNCLSASLQSQLPSRPNTPRSSRLPLTLANLHSSSWSLSASSSSSLSSQPSSNSSARLQEGSLQTASRAVLRPERTSPWDASRQGFTSSRLQSGACSKVQLRHNSALSSAFPSILLAIMIYQWAAVGK